MQKIISIMIAVCLLFVTITPIVDASVRIRKGRNTQVTPYYPQSPNYDTPYQSPYYTAPIYQTQAQVTHSSVGSTYYYSPSYIAKYTYYSTPVPGYYYYTDLPTQTTTSTYTTQQGQYYFSPTYRTGYTYYSSPNPGYYYYYNTSTSPNNSTYTPPNNPNLICTIINNTYQCVNNAYGSITSTYPGCSSADIIIGGQIWASCNALDRNA